MEGSGTIFPKAMALSYGTGDGRIKPRGFVQKGSEYVEKGGYDSEIQKLIDKELSKYWE